MLSKVDWILDHYWSGLPCTHHHWMNCTCTINSLCRLAGHAPQTPGMLRIIASVSERRYSRRREFVAEDLGVLRGVRGHWCGSMRVCARSGRLQVGVADERVGRNQLAACLLQVLVLRYRVHLVDNGEERAVGGQRRGRGGDDVDDAYRRGRVNGFDWTSAITRNSTQHPKLSCLPRLFFGWRVPMPRLQCCYWYRRRAQQLLHLLRQMHNQSSLRSAKTCICGLVRSFEPGLEHVIEMTGSGRGRWFVGDGRLVTCVVYWVVAYT